MLLSATAQVQYAAPPRRNARRSLLSVHFLANDFTTANYLKNHSAIETLSHWTKVKDMNFGLGLNYLQNITNHISFSGRMDGSFTRYYFQSQPPVMQRKILLETDAGFNCKMLPDKRIIVPYLHAGIGFSVYSHYTGVYVPLGAGLQITVSKGAAFLFTNAQYRIGITDHTSDHFNFSIGAGGLLTKERPVQGAPKKPVEVNSVADFDGDGMPDIADSCRTIPGVAKYKGCPVPDTDNDGISDDNDHCPAIPGLLTYGGCPVPDIDGDGINDESDSCITVRGTPAYKGCPTPDSDGDGINDASDECPAIPGSIRNHGCPDDTVTLQNRIDTLAHRIFFATGSAVLLSESLPSLDEVVSLLKQNLRLRLRIEGHTDNTGTDANNLLLSQHRAEAVVRYFIVHGLEQSRLQAKGYGSARPVADNRTIEGKAMNRRVEIKIVRL